MDITQLLQPGCARARVEARSHKAVLSIASKVIAEVCPEVPERGLLQGLLDRERLGSTGLGEGVAIPHCRHPNCPTPVGALITLAEGIDFGAVDGEPVDVLFCLVVPEQSNRTHLDVLAMLTRIFSETDNLASLRQAATDAELFDTICWQMDEVQQW